MSEPAASLTPETRRGRARAVLFAIGLIVLAASFTRAYSGFVASRYSVAEASPTVDLNRDDAAALAQLPGIGPTLAQRIVAERVGRGPFLGLDDVAQRVEGIGPRLVQVLDGLVAFSH